jgi:hypothetical protein
MSTSTSQAATLLHLLQLFNYLELKTRASLSILHPFDPAELRSDFSKHVLMELEWQIQKAKETEALYM